MRVGVYLCACGTNVSGRVDLERVRESLLKINAVAYVETAGFLCSVEGRVSLEEELCLKRPDRVVVGACSPREHEDTFRRVLAKAGLNPFLMQMANLREQVAWVTEGGEEATAKAARQVRAAVKRVLLHEPLEAGEVEACPDTLVIGAGPAGLKAALSLAAAGRKVVLAEKKPALGGLPVRLEKVFPGLECGPCLMESLLAEVLHGDHAAQIEILTGAEVSGVAGFFGNFLVNIRQRPRYVDIERCVGCGECVEVCPVQVDDEYSAGLGRRKAIAFPFPGVLPFAPFLDAKNCLRFKGQDCRLCLEACPFEGSVRYDDEEKILERRVGAVVLATGAGLYSCENLPALGYGRLPDVYSALECEYLAASDGPGAGEFKTSEGKSPESVAIIHCAGSLEPEHKEYCSGLCCQEALKLSHFFRKRLPTAHLYHFYRELVLPGKEGGLLYRMARSDAGTSFLRYGRLAELRLESSGSAKFLLHLDAQGNEASLPVDMVVLCPPVVPSEDAASLSDLLDISCDVAGFFEESHSRMGAGQSKIRGVYLAGACQAPADLREAAGQGMAAAGHVLSALVPGRKLDLNPLTAVVDNNRCSGCGICLNACPCQALFLEAVQGKAAVKDVLCQGCGTCVAACPAGAMQARHFTSAEIIAEIEGLLA